MKLLWIAAPIAACAFLAPSMAVAQSTDLSPVEEIPDPGSLTMPALGFSETAGIADDFKKYFYFHRAGTSYQDAYRDIRECDALASGSSIYMGVSDGAMAGAIANYGALAGGVGGVVGGLIADAIFGSAMRREQRRTNLRNCMNFKGYERYGLSRDLWTAFNFEEGLGRKREPVRLRALALQALVASGPAPITKELGL